MRRTYLGEFEELVLLMIAILDGQAYGVTVSQEIEQQTGRLVTFGAVHNTLIRLEEKGFVRSELGGATMERGGRRKRRERTRRQRESGRRSTRGRRRTGRRTEACGRTSRSITARR